MVTRRSAGRNDRRNEGGAIRVVLIVQGYSMAVGAMRRIRGASALMEENYR
jgi:hypothetical protein